MEKRKGENAAEGRDRILNGDSTESKNNKRGTPHPRHRPYHIIGTPGSREGSNPANGKQRVRIKSLKHIPDSGETKEIIVWGASGLEKAKSSKTTVSE